LRRDVKASNLLLAEDGTVKVADFGIVRFVADATTTLTSTGQIVGTSHYMSPERALGKPAEPPSDVYALGCVLYQLVTGRPPFVADEPTRIMYQHVHETPVPPSEFRVDLDSEFDALVLWMLSKDPVRRPTAAQVAAGERPPAEATMVLPVRRVASKPVFAGVAAGIALAVSAALGILLETKGVRVPATTELAPGNGVATTPAVVPTAPVTPAPRPTRPTPTAPGSPSTTQQTDSRPGAAKAGPKDRKAGEKPKPAKPGKPKKTKP
jgi:serine/threonine-protein kinase